MLVALRNYILVVCLLFSVVVKAQIAKGKVVIDTLYAESLENKYGENPTREVAVYLPPNYDDSSKKYPVIYFLHGFTNDHTIMHYISGLLDEAIADKKIKPVIFVVPNEKTTYDGSFYTNTTLFGNWEDFTVKDLVKHIDTKYRTIADKDSRGITGHSMGGYGALKLAMKHPDVFSSVYALSPGALTVVAEYGPNSDTFKQMATVKNQDDLEKTYFGKVMVAFGKSWSPNPDKAPFYCDMPFEYKNDQLIVHQDVLDKWYQNMPVHMIDTYLENLQQLKAIKLDWGRNAGERFTRQCTMFSQRLENVGITHFAEEYIGTHVNNIYTSDGRIPNVMLPFFNRYLNFELTKN